MPNAIRTDSRTNRTTGLALAGLYSGQSGTVQQHVHDGDTLAVVPKGNIGVRLLGIDTPEVSFSFRADVQFVDLSDDRWNQFLTTVFDDKWGAFSSAVPAELRTWIQAKVTGRPGTTHHQHASQATDRLRAMITEDMQIMGTDPTAFSYYMTFGFEVTDGYGRFLCTINRDQPDRGYSDASPADLQHADAAAGNGIPLFYLAKHQSMGSSGFGDQSCHSPGKARQLAETDRELLTAREHVRNARQQHLGLFDAMNPLLLEPFELRFLSRRELPGRYLIDLNSDSNRLIDPLLYFTVPNPEDRLWISSEYVPLFQKHGWQV